MSFESTGAAVELLGLTKRYGDQAVVDEIALAVAPGEFLTLLGPSGSGKTTTLNMIAGFTEATSGVIRLGGRPVSQLPPHRREIGVVFQHYALFPHMTVLENVAFPLRQRRIRRREARQRAQEALELVDLGPLASRRPKQLSGGQQQRVAVARALVFSPHVLLMDEPLGALDKKLRESLQLEMKRIHQQLGSTFIYVTHDQEEAMVLSDRIAIFNAGRIEQVGSPTELYEQPCSLFVADFVGESNVFRGRAGGEPGTVAVAAGPLLRGTPSVPMRAGTPASLVVRPERLFVTAEDAAPAGANAMSGVVEQAIYLGAARKLQVALSSGATCVVLEQAGRLTTTVPGDRVTVAWTPDCGLVLAE